MTTFKRNWMNWARNVAACCEDKSNIDTCYFSAKPTKYKELVSKDYFQSMTYVSRRIQDLLDNPPNANQLKSNECDCANSRQTVYRSPFTTSPNAGIPVLRDTFKDIMTVSGNDRRKNHFAMVIALAMVICVYVNEWFKFKFQFQNSKQKYFKSLMKKNILFQHQYFDIPTLVNIYS